MYLTGLVDEMDVRTEGEGVKMTDMFMYGRYKYVGVGVVILLGIVISFYRYADSKHMDKK